MTCSPLPQPAPSSVSSLQVAPFSSSSLNVSWQAGAGRRELFRVLLMDQEGALVRNITLKSTLTSTTLDELQPGTRYTVTVVTEAVGLQSSVSKQAVTGGDLVYSVCEGRYLCLLCGSYFVLAAPLLDDTANKFWCFFTASKVTAS